MYASCFNDIPYRSVCQCEPAHIIQLLRPNPRVAQPVQDDERNEERRKHSMHSCTQAIAILSVLPARNKRFQSHNLRICSSLQRIDSSINAIAAVVSLSIRVFITRGADLAEDTESARITLANQRTIRRCWIWINRDVLTYRLLSPGDPSGRRTDAAPLVACR